MIERLIDTIRNAFTAQRPILNMTKELKDLLEPPWTSIFSIRAQYAIYKRIREANQQIAEKLEIRKRTGPDPDTAKLGTTWIKLVVSSRDQLHLPLELIFTLRSSRLAWKSSVSPNLSAATTGSGVRKSPGHRSIKSSSSPRQRFTIRFL